MVPLFQRMSLGDSGDKDLQSESADRLTGTARHSFILFFFSFSVHSEQFKDSGVRETGERWWRGGEGGDEEEVDERTVTVDHTLTDRLTWVSRFPAL